MHKRLSFRPAHQRATRPDGHLGMAGPTAIVALASALSLLAGCEMAVPTPPAASTSPPTVITVAAKYAQTEEQTNFVGRVVAVDRVALRARIAGFLKERRFTEGQDVEAHHLLFLIEPDKYQAVLDQREADVARAKAEDKNARAQLARGEDLLGSSNISTAEVDDLRAAQAVAVAKIAQAEAKKTAAGLDLSYTQIRAPVDGRIGIARYSVGSFVGPNSEALSTIVSRDPIYVQFPVTLRERLQVRRQIGGDGNALQGKTVSARLPDGSIYGQKGYLDAVDVTTNASTDTLTVRAVFPNPDGILVDGQSVGIFVSDDTPAVAITVPQSALRIDQRGIFVLIVNDDSKAEARYLKVGSELGPNIVVTSGLNEGERVIIQGSQKVGPGQEVIAKTADEAAHAEQ